MGRPLTSTFDNLEGYCHAYTYTDCPVMPATRRQLGIAIGLAERECVRISQLRSDYPRLLSTYLTDEHDPLRGLSVIRLPRYAVRNREAPKRSTLIRRLWSLLR